MLTTTTTLRPDISRSRAAWRMPTPSDVVVKGERIRYFEQGEGAPLVLMHVGSYAVATARASSTLPPISRLIVVAGAVGKFKFPEPETRGFFHDVVAKEVEARPHSIGRMSGRIRAPRGRIRVAVNH
jgi:hypothetical protein